MTDQASAVHPVDNVANVNKCTKCTKCGKTAVTLQHCARCKSRAYCGKACQEEDWPVHKASCTRQNYILKVDLFPNDIANPSISRTLSCPATASFFGLHSALQVAFDWANCHAYAFTVLGDKSVTFGDRTMAIPQDVMRITEPFSLGFDEDEDEDPKPSNCWKTYLYSVLEGRKTAGMPIHYEYDFGDSWCHTIALTGRAPPTDYFECIAGEGHGCAEDVGGLPGWETLLEAYRARRKNAEQKRLKVWYETQAANGDPKGLAGNRKWKWDKKKVNSDLKDIPIAPKYQKPA